MTANEIISKWNAEADEFNQWDELCEDKKVEFAFKCGVDSVKLVQENQMVTLANIINQEDGR